MIVIENGIEYAVLAKISENEQKSYLAVDNKNNLYFFSNVEKEQLIEKGVIINEHNTDDNTVSELDYINKEVCYKIWFEDYVSEYEKEKYNKMKNDIILDYKNYLYKLIKKELYKENIQNKKLEIWKNNFEDLFYELGNNEYYIDDKEYDIFYKISEFGEYEFNFVEK